MAIAEFETENGTEFESQEPASGTRAKRRPGKPVRAAQKAEAEAEAAGNRVIRLQGNWKRRQGVATRYELSLAIDRLLSRGRLEVADGCLRLSGKSEKAEVVSQAEEWRRKDDELRAYCQRMHVNETKSPKSDYGSPDLSAGSMLDAGTMRAEPRHVAKYVLRELRDAGPIGYEALIDKIDGLGGLEWVLEEERKPQPVSKGRKRR